MVHNAPRCAVGQGMPHFCGQKPGVVVAVRVRKGANLVDDAPEDEGLRRGKQHPPELSTCRALLVRWKSHVSNGELVSFERP